MRHEIHTADGKRLIGYAVETTNAFGRRVLWAYWAGDSVPVKDRRWNRDFGSVAEVERYLRAWLSEHDRIEAEAALSPSPDPACRCTDRLAAETGR